MSSRPKSKQAEALQFLDDLDSLAPPPADGSAPPSDAPPSTEGEAEVYAFIDEITQKSSEPSRSTVSLIERPISRAGTPTVRKSTERVKVGAGAPLLPSVSRDSSGSRVGTPVKTEQQQPEAQSTSSGSGWGWGSVWTTASAAIQQAKSAVDEQVKNLPKNEQARKWGEGVLEYAKSAQLDKLGNDFKTLGLSTLTDILNVVAPPISEHEVIQVYLSHDMQGYEGVESLVYRALLRILEQVEGGDLVVNRGDESRPKGTSDGRRDLNAVEGFDAAIKLSQANIAELIKNATQPAQTESSTQNPIVYSYVYLRIQPYISSFEIPSSSTDAQVTTSHSQSSLQFLIYLSDPAHELVHSTVTQAVPGHWLELWDKYDWVEDLVVEALRVGVEVVGQEYIASRMSWDNNATDEKEEVGVKVVVDKPEE